MEYKLNGSKPDENKSNKSKKYEWNNQFLEYGTLRVSNISYFKNKGANRCKTPYVYDIEVESNHNFYTGNKN